MRILAVILLTILTSCSTLEIVHNPVGCEGEPVFPAEIAFLDEEVKGANKAMVDKFKKRIKILRERIKTQCKLNAEHDKLHESN
jgi:hypothetical protein